MHHLEREYFVFIRGAAQLDCSSPRNITRRNVDRNFFVREFVFYH